MSPSLRTKFINFAGWAQVWPYSGPLIGNLTLKDFEDIAELLKKMERKK